MKNLAEVDRGDFENIGRMPKDNRYTKITYQDITFVGLGGGNTYSKHHICFISFVVTASDCITVACKIIKFLNRTTPNGPHKGLSGKPFYGERAHRV